MQTHQTSLGALLTEQRTARGISMEQAAHELGVRTSAYRLWEKDASLPSAKHIGRVSIWLRQPLGRLLHLIGMITKEEEQELLTLARQRRK